MKKAVLIENDKWKFVRSEHYNYNFDRENGFFIRWGKTLEDEPRYSFIGPEILDLEISNICHRGCPFCYKSNTKNGKNMSFGTFKKIFHKFPRTLTQVAFGIGSIDANPDLWKIMEYCRSNDYNKVVPNITINGDNLTDEYASNLVKLCGAVSVSRYDPDTCYNAVKKLTDLGLKQTNIHQLVSLDTLKDCYQVIDDWENDKRLSKLNAIVFLLMKPKGKRNRLHQLTDINKYKELINYALDEGAPIGFDSCSASSFLNCVRDRDNYKQLETVAESCESTCFSCYVDVNGVTWPCSFCEDLDGISGINLLDIKDFMKEVWYGEPYVEFRKKLLSSCSITGCRECPAFNLKME